MYTPTPPFEVKITIKLWDVSNGKKINTFQGHSDIVTSVAFSPDGKTLASGSGDQTVRLWDVASGKNTMTLGAPNKLSVHLGVSVSFSPDGKTLAQGGMGLKLWDVASGKNTLDESGGRFVAYHPNGKMLASGGFYHNENHKPGEIYKIDDKELPAIQREINAIKLWDVTTGKTTATLYGHTQRVSSVAFSPDGKTLASLQQQGGTIKLWDVTSGKNTMTLEAQALCLAFRPDVKPPAEEAPRQK